VNARRQVVVGGQGVQGGLPAAPRQQDQRLALGAEDEAGDPALERLQGEADRVAECGEAVESGVYGDFVAFRRDRRHCTSFPGLVYVSGVSVAFASVDMGDVLVVALPTLGALAGGYAGVLWRARS
jgi:hypothetical protein